jgi:DNA ligase-1
VLPFIALQSRLGRKDPSAALLAEVPVIYVASDVLGFGQPRAMTATPARPRRRPTSRRRRRAHAGAAAHGAPPSAGALGCRSPRTAALRPVPPDEADSTDALEAVFAEARARRNEGLMVKDPTSIYSPGRRGYGWLKMKKALATIDCVVVGVEVGHGKRHGVLSDYTFAVRDEARDQLVTIGKATAA